MYMHQVIFIDLFSIGNGLSVKSTMMFLMLCKKKFSLMGDMLDFFQKLFFPARCSKYLFSLAIEEHQFKIYVLL